MSELLKESLTALSLNLRDWSTEEQDGIHAWEPRKPRCIALINDSRPTIFGFQECSTDTAEEFLAHHPWARLHLGPPIEHNNYRVPIFYDHDRLHIVRSGGFWLNETPSQRGKGWDAGGERATSWVLLQERDTQQEVLGICAHWDEKGIKARRRSAETTAGFIRKEFPSARIVYFGDFNSDPFLGKTQKPNSTAPYWVLQRAGLQDTYRTVHTHHIALPNTFHEYKGDGYQPNAWGSWYIDWMLYRGLAPVGMQLVKRGSPRQLHHSDHFGLLGRFQITPHTDHRRLIDQTPVYHH